MIHTPSFASGLDYVELNWTRPRFRPEDYQLKYVCTVKRTSTQMGKKKQSNMENATNLGSGATSFRISELRPNSVCIVFMLAVYNPASIDSGIAVTGMTSGGDTRKKIFVYLK